MLPANRAGLNYQLLNVQNVVNPKYRLQGEARSTARKADDIAGRGMQRKRKLRCNGADRAAGKAGIPTPKGGRLLRGLSSRENLKNR